MPKNNYKTEYEAARVFKEKDFSAYDAKEVLHLGGGVPKKKASKIVNDVYFKDK